ncbi:hypothetical protein [Pseudomonas sp. S3_H06]
MSAHAITAIPAPIVILAQVQAGGLVTCYFEGIPIGIPTKKIKEYYSLKTIR